MPPKKAANVHIVLDADGSILEVHASKQSAEAFKGDDDTIITFPLLGGTVTLSAEPAPKKAAAPKPKSAKSEEDDAPKADTAIKKTKTPAQQRAANAKGAKKGTILDEDLPDNVKALLNGKGDQLKGMAVIVTGVPPTIGRANAEKLVVLCGGKVSKSLSKNTSLVVVGNEAGPTKLEKIEELGLKTVDEDGLISMLEGGGGASKKRAASDDEEEEEPEPEEEKPKKGKKQKK